MKTAQYFVQRWETLSTLLFASHSTKAEVKTALAKFIEEEIQRDAREGMIDRKLAQETLEEAMEGMVPIQDVMRLLEDSDRIAEQLAAACQAFRAKHPNQFTKPKSNALTPHERNNVYGHPDTD